MNSLEQTIQEVTAQFSALAEGEDVSRVPSRKAVIQMIKEIQHLFFPRFFPLEKNLSAEKIVPSIAKTMEEQITAAYSFAKVSPDRPAGEITESLLKALPKVREKLLLDVQALYEGDPAARSREEVILTYPGFYAISIYRIAHEFYRRGIPYLSRMMTEFAHEKTGIDIHAGATVGDYFFIDHGTGIVIGETTTIGSRVKIYQGVTLGAKSFELDENGNPVKGTKRHPDIGNNVVLYANATILGGSTKIGDHCVIGGNVWLTHSVDAGQVVYYSENHERHKG